LPPDQSADEPKNVPTNPNLLDEQLFQRFLEVSPDALVIVDAGGTIVRTNDQALELFGYEREALLGRPVEVLLPLRFRHRHREHRDGYQARPHVRAMGEGLELFGVRRDGQEFPVDISLGPVETGRGLVVVAAVRDATERKRIEALARQVAEARLRRRQALELNDGVVQGLATASMALALGDTARTEEILAATLTSARSLVSQMLGELESARELVGGDLVRSAPADLRPEEP
jgi:PAS domain S-box-containing protein